MNCDDSFSSLSSRSSSNYSVTVHIANCSHCGLHSELPEPIDPTAAELIYSIKENTLIPKHADLMKEFIAEVASE
jgi:hypothetical protein